MSTKIITEGTTKIEVPIPDENSNFPPSSVSVFYNPEMKLNRDVSVAAIACFSKDRPDYTYLDALSASGIRGLRIANEVGLETTMSDWEEDSVRMIENNITLNNLENCTAIQRNANVVMLDNNFDIIDLDPFGTPAPFLDAACRATRKLLCITATDTAPLCGSHKKAGIRRYGAIPLKTDYYPEMGVRMLIGAMVRNLASQDKALKPLLSYASQHYYRVFAEVKKSVKSADECLKQMGFVLQCFKCGEMHIEKGLAVHIAKECTKCGETTSLAGPLWLGSLHDKDFCNEVLDECENREFTKAGKLITLCRDELDIPLHYDYHKLSKSLGISARRTDELVRVLNEQGFAASRTHFSGVSFKTDATLDELKKIATELSS